MAFGDIWTLGEYCGEASKCIRPFGSLAEQEMKPGQIVLCLLWYNNAFRRPKMNSIIRDYEKTVVKEEGEVPDIRPGDIVRVHISFFEGRGDHVPLKKIHRIAAKGKIQRGEVKVERTQVFEGTVIAVRGAGARKKITVRKISSGIGVEKTWFVHSRKISKIEVVRRSEVRRAKLYYLRHRIGKATRLKEKLERPTKTKRKEESEIASSPSQKKERNS